MSVSDTTLTLSALSLSVYCTAQTRVQTNLTRTETTSYGQTDGVSWRGGSSGYCLYMFTIQMTTENTERIYRGVAL